jgi:hypothetical protein
MKHHTDNFANGHLPGRFTAVPPSHRHLLAALAVASALLCLAFVTLGATTVSLSRVPDAGTRTLMWTGCGSVSGEGQCVISLSKDKVTTTSKLLSCRPSFHRKKVNGRIKCVKAKGHAAHGRRSHRNNASVSCISGWLGRGF